MFWMAYGSASGVLVRQRVSLPVSSQMCTELLLRALRAASSCWTRFLFCSTIALSRAATSSGALLSSFLRSSGPLSVSIGIVRVGPVHDLYQPRLVRPVGGILQQRGQEVRSRRTLRRLPEISTQSYFCADKSGERFCLQGADSVGWSGIRFAASGEQGIGFAHLLAGGIQERLDHAVFKENPLRVLPASIRIAAGPREQTKDPWDLQRFARQFADRSMKIRDRQFFVAKIGPGLSGDSRADGKIAAVLKECAARGIRRNDWLPGLSSPAFSGAGPESALGQNALLKRVVADNPEQEEA